MPKVNIKIENIEMQRLMRRAPGVFKSTLQDIIKKAGF